MIRKLLRRVFSRRSSPPGQAQSVPRSRHGVSRDKISSAARRTVTGLQEKGYAAYVVGGAVRDLLLGLEPKDFDVATDATPEQVRAVFRRSRIIGRRFRLVHVMFGDETVEVSTYRARHGADPSEGSSDEHGRILRDNVFGTQQEDASRRDFTINALFYDPTSEQITDFCGGLDDLKARRLRMIGDPEQRYREDPVRMLRAVRLAAKLGMKIEADTREPIKRLAPLLANVPAARLFEEMMKLLLSGHATACLLQLRHEGLHHGLLPMLDVILEQPMGERFVMLALQRTDERIREDKPVSPGFLFAALLWHEVLAAWKLAQEEGLAAMPALFKAMDHVVQVQAEKLSIPRRFGADMKEIWALQPRMLARSGRRPYSVLAHPRFRAGYDFLVLRCDSGEVDAEVAEWWENFQKADEETRKQMLLPDRGPKRRRRRRKPRGEAAPAPEAAE
ncbi:MAG TPA: polynucleotide adenylyltransferase PcnB [Burkholderiales bacterium]|jgi:poly(A) polymerase|nr:polynucleotide adenylyltransferase PcnB [Burkholderiales bacterium]